MAANSEGPPPQLSTSTTSNKAKNSANLSGSTNAKDNPEVSAS